MMIEFNGALQSFNTLKNLISANKSLSNYNELVAAVSEVYAKLITAQSVAMASQEKQSTLTQRITELEKEIMQLKDWNREAERYQLTELTSGVFAYMVKSGMENGEPSHYLCANCFSQREKTILHLDDPGTMVRCFYFCPRCNGKFYVPSQKRVHPIRITRA